MAVNIYGTRPLQRTAEIDYQTDQLCTKIIFMLLTIMICLLIELHRAFSCQPCLSCCLVFISVLTGYIQQYSTDRSQSVCRL